MYLKYYLFSLKVTKSSSCITEVLRMDNLSYSLANSSYLSILTFSLHFLTKYGSFIPIMKKRQVPTPTHTIVIPSI